MDKVAKPRKEYIEMGQYPGLFSIAKKKTVLKMVYMRIMEIKMPQIKIVFSGTGAKLLIRRPPPIITIPVKKVTTAK